MDNEDEFIQKVYEKYEEAKKNNWKGYESILEKRKKTDKKSTK